MSQTRNKLEDQDACEKDLYFFEIIQSRKCASIVGKWGYSSAFTKKEYKEAMEDVINQAKQCLNRPKRG